MRNAGVGHAEDVVHLLGGHRDGRRVEPDVHLAVLLHQGTGVAGVGLQVQHAVGVGVEHRVVAHLLERRQADHGLVAGQPRVGQQLHHLGFLRVFDRPLFLLDGAGGGVLGVDVGVDDLVDLARTVDTGGVDLEPAFGGVAAQEGGAAHVRDVFDLLAV
ncbi:hypothetical protein D3C84_855910 [compost metagenome]